MAAGKPVNRTVKRYQRSWSGGEIAPWLYTRGDHGKYGFSAGLLRNTPVSKSGSAFNRPGTEFVAEVADSTKTTALIPWIFDADDRYALQLGDGTLRFHQSGSTLTAGSPAAWSSGLFYVTGDLVVDASVNYYCRAPNTNKTPASNATEWYPMPSTGAASGVLELPTPFDDDEVFAVRYAQSFDVMWLTHPLHPPYRLQRLAQTTWTLLPETFLPSMAAPYGIAMSGAGTTGGAATWRYKVVAIKKGDKPIESLAGHNVGYLTGTLSGGGGSNISVTTTAHGFPNGAFLLLVDAFPTGGATDAGFEAIIEGFQSGGLSPLVAATAANTFEIAGTSGFPAVPSNYSLNYSRLGTGMGTSPYFNEFANTNGDTDSDGLLTFASAHGLATGDEITILHASVGTTEEARAQVVHHNFIVTVLSSTTATLNNSKGIDWTNDVAVLAVARAEVRTTTGDAVLSTTNKIVLAWAPLADAGRYWIFKYDTSGNFAYLAQAETNTFTDDGSLPIADSADGPPVAFNPFLGAGNFPACVGLYQQRLIFGGTTNDPSKVWFSQSGDFLNYTAHAPVRPSDSFAVELAATGVGVVQHIVDTETLVLLAFGRKLIAKGDADGSITPTAVNPRARGGTGGAGPQRPVTVDEHILFVDALEGLVRQFRLDLVLGQTAADLTAFAPHLFKGYTLVQLWWQEVPDPTLYAVRSDGKLISMTFVPEQEILACCRSDTGITRDETSKVETVVDFGFESGCIIPEGGVLRAYVIVRRTVNGSSKRYVERVALRKAGEPDYDLINDAWFLDCAAKYDAVADTLQLGSELRILLDTVNTGDWSEGSTETNLRINGGTYVFSAADVGRAYKLVSGADSVIVDVTAYVNPGDLQVTPRTDIPVSLQGVFTATWYLGLAVVGGLSHLEGRAVGVFGDGEDRGTFTVNGSGQITLPVARFVIVAGLRYLPQIRTLPPASGNNPAFDSGQLEDLEKVGTHVTADLTDTVANRDQGLRAGTTVDETFPVQLQFVLPTAAATDLVNGKAVATLGGTLAKDAAVWLEMVDPLPMMVNGLILEYSVEGSAG